LRDAHDRIRQAGGEVVAIGTGDVDHARAFVADERIPYPVLVDDEARAARAAEVRRVGFLGMFHPASYAGTRRAWRAGHRIGRAGRRVDQLGSTFVVGPGPVLRYAHRDRHSADHAPLPQVLAALASQ
jgi:peroxiredoxin